MTSSKPAASELFAIMLTASIHEIKNRFGLLYNDLDALLEQADLRESEQANAVKSEAQFIGNELMRVLASYKTLQEDFSPLSHQYFAEDFVEDMLARHSYTLKAHNVTTQFDCEEDISGHFDNNIVGIVFDTLLYNAIGVNATELYLNAHEDDTYLYIELHDNGPGFPEAMLNNTQPTTGKLDLHDQSSGLGLHFARLLLDTHQEADHRGHLVLSQSTHLSGACATIALPL